MRGRTQRGRERTTRGLSQIPTGRPLIRLKDHGPGEPLDTKKLGFVGDRWIEPFLEANGSVLRRLGVSTAVVTRGGLSIQLTPGARIGAVPLLSPSTRRVSAGLLVEPRFRWSALGAVLGQTSFATEPTVGGTPLVPGSAREVPAWLLAAPVIRRLEALLRHRKRGFSEREETRQSPRGHVDWGRWARTAVPAGRWSGLPCRFTEPDDDPALMSAVRWTLARLDEELSHAEELVASRILRARLTDLRNQIGPGASRRPSVTDSSIASTWVDEAIQAMAWVAEERGLGGARVLDGMSWDLPIDELWEAWVDSFVADLAPRCGMVALRRGGTTRRVNWSTPTASMRMLIPDTGLRGTGRLVWIDAKYKAHLQLLSRHGWAGLEEPIRDAHRADLHQALAYTSLESVAHVDSMLVYPQLSPGERNRHALATIAAGRRRVRLLLVGLPFGFHSPEHRESTLSDWRELLAA